MQAYKLLSRNVLSYGGHSWALGRKEQISASGQPRLCSRTVYHAYRSDLLASFMAPIHVPETSRIFVVECEPILDDGTKIGATWMTPIREIDLPRPSAEQRVAFGILAAARVSRSGPWREWAKAWLSGEDRTERAANAAKAVANAYAAAYAAANAASVNAYAAANADANAYAAYAAANVANAAANAAANAYAAASHVDTVSLAQRAFEYDWGLYATD